MYQSLRSFKRARHRLFRDVDSGRLSHVDGTPGGTKQACVFRDAFDELQQAGVTEFGVLLETVRKAGRRPYIARFGQDRRAARRAASSSWINVKRSSAVTLSALIMSSRSSAIADRA